MCTAGESVIKQPCAQQQKPTGQNSLSLSTGKEDRSSQNKEGKSVVISTMELSPAHTIDLRKVLYILVTKYFMTAWKDALDSANLSQSFPNLVHDITHESLIGNPPPLLCTFIPDNLSSANICLDIIRDELQEETAAGCMSSPFSIEEAHIIFNSHFRTSPIRLVKKVPGNGKWHMIWHLSKTDSNGFSTNLSLDSHNFPTTYFLPADVAAWVSTFCMYPGVLGYVCCCIKDAHPWCS